MPTNTQPIHKQDLSTPRYLALHHTFYTIQGEGPHAGKPALFVRLFGCNLQCPMCDTDYTSEKKMVNSAYLINKAIVAFPTTFKHEKLIVFSGGEPFRQPIGQFVRELREAGFIVQIETNGTLYLEDFPYEDPGVVIVCSPKTGKISPKLLPHIHTLKYVLHADQINPLDGLPITALAHTASPQVARPPADFQGDILVHPIDVQNASENARHLDATIRSSLTFGYRLGIQLHKVINME